jgi:hypothetical protein
MKDAGSIYVYARTANAMLFENECEEVKTAYFFRLAFNTAAYLHSAWSI